MADEPKSPPFTPLDGTRVWYESDGAKIAGDRDLTVLITRLGIASNALAAHELAGVRAIKGTPAQRLRGLINSMITSAVYTYESVRLGQQNMKRLRPLAQAANVDEATVQAFGSLCAGKHPASDLLKRARNHLGFHWEDEVIRASAIEFERNQSVIWTEFDANFHPIQRLAHEVVTRALFSRELAELADEDSEGARERLQETVRADRPGNEDRNYVLRRMHVRLFSSCDDQRSDGASDRCVVDSQVTFLTP